MSGKVESKRKRGKGVCGEDAWEKKLKEKRKRGEWEKEE